MPNPIKRALKKAYRSERFSKKAVKAYSTLFPPPYLRDNMEFEWDIWNGISSFHSQSGRQIGENNTGPDLYKENIPTEHRICKFEGSRNGLPINVTALREVMSAWDDALQLATIIRNDYLQRRGIPGQRLNLLQSYAYSKMGAAIPAFLARRSVQPIRDGSVNPLGAAFFTLGVGPFMVVRAMMEKGDLRVLDHEPLSAECMYELADTSGSIVSAMGKGCAGSKKHFLELLDAVMNGTYKKPLESVEANRMVASIGALEPFYQYVFAASRLELLIKLYKLISARIALLLLDRPGALSAEQQALAAEVVDNCYAKASETLDQPTVIQHFTHILLELLAEMDGSAAQQALVKAGVMDDQGNPTGLDAAAPAELRARAVSQLRTSAELLFEQARQQLDLVNQSLGRSKSKAITLADFYRRCGGRMLEQFASELSQ